MIFFVNSLCFSAFSLGSFGCLRYIVGTKTKQGKQPKGA
nr:MAG TPA: hypothetical protein [Caudoviricetes sp.]